MAFWNRNRQQKQQRVVSPEITELMAKSHYIPSLRLNDQATQGTHIFFSWDLFAKARNHGIALDWNAFSDVERQVLELIKIIYVSAEDYVETASTFEPQPENRLSLERVTAWAKIYDTEFRVASKYIIEHIAVRFMAKADEQKKSSRNQRSKSRSKS